jgi:DNA invertase Pin-like site-specific DNA recombinase
MGGRGMNLLELWNEHIVRGNRLSRELEEIEDLISKAKESDICFSSGNNGAIFIRVLSSEKMQELKESAMIYIMRARDEKETELQGLMGKLPAFPEKRNPAIVNPEFEAAVKEMEGKTQPDPVEEKHTEILQEEAKRIEELPLKPSEILEQHTDEVIKMYSQMATYQAIADKFGVKKGDVNNFFTKHKTTKRTSKKDDEFLDSKVQARRS